MKKIVKGDFSNVLKKISGIIILLFMSLLAFTQNAGISPAGAQPPEVNAGLDINFVANGLLIPRVILTGTTASAPLNAHVAGMIVYNTATAGDVSPGFYFNNGTKWVEVFPKAVSAGQMQYWDGTSWVNIAAGTQGQRLRINASGVPAWTH